VSKKTSSYPTEPIIAWGCLLAGEQIKWESLKVELDVRREQLKAAQKEISKRIPKRGMSRERIETAKAFSDLLVGRDSPPA
jgi:hypothetical protein